MSKIINVEINQETVNFMQAIAYKVKSTQTLLVTIGEQLGAKSQVFKEYEEEYIEYSKQYEILKEKFKEIYVPKELHGHRTTWSLDFQTNLLTIEVSCECGISLVDAGLFDNYKPNLGDDVAE